MAVTASTQPNIPEPLPVAEAGVTTSEWALVVRYAYGATLAGVAVIAARVGLNPPDVEAVVAATVLSVGVAVASYVYSRGVRKANTTK